MLENLLTEWAKLLMHSFAQAGVTDVVLSPGSRSTPFLVAALRESRFRCHDVIDERGAAFFALGQARWTERPTLLLCTSGTAAAHYYPAIVEASLARVPMLVLTADRPFELQEFAAPQTIDQTKLYGRYVRQFFELGMPDGEPGALLALRRMAAQATFSTSWPEPGPVHVNVRARKPLEPREPRAEDERDLARRVRALVEALPVVTSAPRVHAEAGAIARVAQQCREARAGLIVCGPSPVSAQGAREALFRFAEKTGFPVLAEATSQLRLTRFAQGRAARAVRICDAFHTVFKSKQFRDEHVPDLIVQVGAPPTSGAWEQFVSRHPTTPRILVARHGWNDTLNTASALLVGDISDTLEKLAAELDTHDAGRAGPWAERLAAANGLAWSAVDAELAESGERSGALSEAGAVRTVLGHLPPGSLLGLGNSLPIRHVETVAKQGCAEVLVLCQRGANGIDGGVAGILGAASAAHRPATLIVGDLGFLHDVNSLMLGTRVTVPVVLVVLNNGGGRIFEHLPIATDPHVKDDELRHVTTPHALQFQAAATLFGLAHHAVSTHDELSRALETAYAVNACTIVECAMPPSGAVELDRRIRARFERALDAGARGSTEPA